MTAFPWITAEPTTDDDRDVRVEGSGDCHEYAICHRRKGGGAVFEWSTAPTLAAARLYQVECYYYLNHCCTVWITAAYGAFVVGEVLT